MMARGNVGQIQKQERMMEQITELYKSVPLVSSSLGVVAFPPSQETMAKNFGDEQKCPKAEDAPPDDIVNDTKAEKKPIDVTNTCNSICGCLCTCGILGFTKQTVELDDAHLIVRTKNNCDDSEVKLPYAQLGSVDMNKSCCCCYGVNEFVPGCGCSKSLVETLHNELQARNVKRGNIAQVKQLERMQWQAFMLDTGALTMVEAEGMKFPPDQQIMSNMKFSQPHILDKQIAHMDPAVKFQVKDYDITNFFEALSSCCCCCGPTYTSMQLQEEEMFIAKENWCLSAKSRTPYAQLGSVDTENAFGCCMNIPEVANPGCGCQKTKCTEIAADLQERKVKRGNIAQLKMQENLIYSVVKLDAKLDMLMNKHGVKYPPSSDTMKQVFGQEMFTKAPSGAPPQQMKVVIPAGVGPGQVIQVQTPQGTPFNVTIPQGVAAGQELMVQVPGA
jgi:hypothetical protein